MASTTHERQMGRRSFDCVGLLYYSAFMQQSGAAPVCLGFSQARDDLSESHQQQHHAGSRSAAEQSSSPAQAQRENQGSAAAAAAAGGSADFKMLCVGYSTYSTGPEDEHTKGASSLPHCEGVEVVLHMHPAAAAAPGSREQQEQQQQGPGSSGSGASRSLFAPDGNSNNSTQEQQGQLAPLWSRLGSRAAQNVSAVQAALRNEGPVKLKPWPKDAEELEARLAATFERHMGRMQRGVERVASNAYASTVKPLAAIMGLSGSSRSSPKAP